MDNPKFELKTEGSHTYLIITCKLPKGKEVQKSKSGKSNLYASTNGNMNTGLKVSGDDIIVGLNAYTKV